MLSFYHIYTYVFIINAKLARDFTRIMSDFFLQKGVIHPNIHMRTDMLDFMEHKHDSIINLLGSTFVSHMWPSSTCTHICTYVRSTKYASWNNTKSNHTEFASNLATACYIYAWCFHTYEYFLKMTLIAAIWCAFHADKTANKKELIVIAIIFHW